MNLHKSGVMTMVKHLGVVLAGGQSRRFGSPKAFAEIHRKPFYQHSIEAVKPCTEKQVIITSTALKDEFKKYDHDAVVYTDEPSFAGKGPLAGIYTAMAREHAEWYVTVPTDVPLIQTCIFEHLLQYADENTQAIVPVAANRLQPLISVYHASVKGVLQENLKNNKQSVRQLLDRIQVKYVTFEEESPFMNINKQEDYRKIKPNHNGGK